MSSALVIAPIATGLLGGVIAMLLPERRRGQALVVTALLHFGVALLLFLSVLDERHLVLQSGGWPAPLGISLVADLFAASMVLLTGFLGLVVSLQARRGLDAEEMGTGAAATIPILLAGVNTAFLAGDLFHLYVAFEVMLISSFVLLSQGNAERRQATVQYLIPSLLSSALLLAGVGLVYGVTGTLNMASLASLMTTDSVSPALGGAAGLLACAFLLKSAAFPVFAWLPASYPEAPPVLTALFAGLLTKVGVYALLRIFTLVLPGAAPWLPDALLVIAAATMVIGVLGAVAQWEMQRLLSFHVVSQIGYLLLGVGLGTPLAIAATLIYFLHNSIAKTALLLGGGLVRELRGHDHLKELGGLVRSQPWLSGLFLIAALGLAGVPPLSGFWAKLGLLRAALDAEAYVLLGVAATVSVLTFLSMAKIWSSGFWGTAPEGTRETRLSWAALTPLGLLVAAVIGLGLAAGPAFELAEMAAEDMLDPSRYVTAVLGDAR